MYKCKVCKSKINEAERLKHRTLCVDSSNLRKRKADEMETSSTSDESSVETDNAINVSRKIKLQRVYIVLPCKACKRYVDPSDKLNHRRTCQHSVSTPMKRKHDQLDSVSGESAENKGSIGKSGEGARNCSSLLCTRFREDLKEEQNTQSRSECIELYDTAVKFENLHI